MIPKEELYFKVLDYIINNKQSTKIIDMKNVLAKLGLNEYIPHAYEIARELKDKGYVAVIPLHDGILAIENYTLDAKFFVDEYLIRKDEKENFETSSNITNGLDIFISHSSRDTEIVQDFVELLIKAFKMDESKIRCTSVPGHKLASGSNVDITLKKEIIDSKVFVGFITEESIKSTYVLFELGARWGSDLGYRLINIDGSLIGKLKAPLNNHHINNISERSGLYQILNELRDDLGYTSYNSSAVESYVQNLLESIKNLTNEKPVNEEPAKSQDEFSSIEMEVLKSAD